ncbi:hypothetical protein AGR7C_Cc200004 [Agrobacterium deltaense Zutra 3/1]|uniref:Uncharacterized protein n=1 Tax=Agrobacterium deltaense Zutra 3/1 TaxID=1183427 RepID=A0A1S7PZ69_9HYPH|nr:hypothetical protein AGR7C_Cc200004 [Agrobacterium deltaense Zutra 3/1]
MMRAAQMPASLANSDMGNHSVLGCGYRADAPRRTQAFYARLRRVILRIFGKAWAEELTGRFRFFRK